MSNVVQLLATELSARQEQINAAISLLDEGATVPFIARYRKEATGGLDDGQLRQLEQRLGYLRELNDRREVILNSIKEQGKLTPQLQQKLLAASGKTELEDIYLPFKPKRRTKGQIAIELGLQPLADELLADPNASAQQAAEKYLTTEQGLDSIENVLEGAQSIIIEQLAEDALLLAKLRKHVVDNGFLHSRRARGLDDAAIKKSGFDKFRDYFEHTEQLKNVPSHRALAMFRGRNEGALSLKLGAAGEDDKNALAQACERIIAEHLKLPVNQRNQDNWLENVVSNAWKKKILGHMETEQLTALKEKAETAAIEVFAKNLKDVLMAAPAGAKTTMGLDPGLRTGVKVAIVDKTGKFCDHCTIYPHAPQNHWDKALRTLSHMCRQHKVELIAIGNGTASRETDKLAAELAKANPELQLSKVMVSEAGASVYSASELAANEFPALDVSIRGAISIARRLQDPLAELVKIEAKAIGVGQYQHDVNQSQLAGALDNVVEDCVNGVGVDLNMASAPLLSRVSGLNKTLAKNIVAYRDEHGQFKDRETLKKVTRLGPKAFEQCAGFLRIIDGDNPLDGSGVHPESYSVVERIVAKDKMSLSDIIGNSQFLQALNADDFTDETFGVPTVKDIIAELDKPGRDPRGEFKTASFKEGVESIDDLKVGMMLEGVVSNVANFGAFVDIGVHQDGLVHISSLTDKFVSDPRDVVKAGDVVKVKVMEVDVSRKRINLTMRLNEQPQQSCAKDNNQQAKEKVGKSHHNKGNKDKPKATPKPQNAAMGNAFADAFAKLKK